MIDVIIILAVCLIASLALNGYQLRLFSKQVSDLTNKIMAKDAQQYLQISKGVHDIEKPAKTQKVSKRAEPRTAIPLVEDNFDEFLKATGERS